MEMISQSHWMRLYNEKERDEFNPIFFQRSNQEIMDCVKKVILSCERDKYFTLKVLEMREVYDYEEIYNLLKDHESKKRRSANNENPYDFIDIKDSDIMLLKVKYFIRHNGPETEKINGEDTIVWNPWEILNVLICLPRFVHKYYFRLQGNYYSDIFQIVDGSTYNNTAIGGKTKKVPQNSFKTMFTPIRIFKMYKDLTDYNMKTSIRNNYYTSIIFNNHVICMYYLLACFGLYGCMEFLDIKCIQITNTPILSSEWYCFERYGIYVSYPKECAKDAMVQSLAVTIYEGINKDAKLDDLFDIRYWIINLGKSFANASIDKGLFILDSIDGTYDIITREELHLPEDMKANIYQILRWLMREFNYLRNKSNVDVTLKRLRIGEPIAMCYAEKLSAAIYALSDLGKKVTLKSVRQRIYTAPMFVINKIMGKKMTNLVSYRDLPNDNDATLALKYTYKGISGLGETGSIQQGYRRVDPSHAGILDLDSSTTSDPGMSGTICPTAKIYGGNSFSEYQEPNFWEEESKPLQTEFFNRVYGQPKKCIEFKDQPQDDYTGLRQKIIDENLQLDQNRIKIPIFDLNGETDYTIAGALTKEQIEEEQHITSLFDLKDNSNSSFTIK